MKPTMDDFTFVWHDYETFGAVPRRDRPCQFAAVRTNAALEEVGEPVMMYCKPAPDYLPDPESCLLTGIVPQTCLARGVPEHEFAQRVQALLGEPGTVGVGYNTIRFDDEVTRFLLWRNLMDPYGREWQNGCGRWDLLDVVRCTWALRPQGLQWPRHEDGRPSFKLEHLAAANGLLHEAAHDALSDVRATIALARLIRQQQPRLWDHCLKLRRKDAVLAEAGLDRPREAWRPFVHISGMFGHELGCLSVVWPLAQHPTNRNEVLVWDLRHDPAPLFEMGVDELRLRLFTRAAELPEGVERLPIKSIHVNKSPVVIGNLKILNDELLARWKLDLPQVLRHAEAAAAKGPLLDGMWAEVYRRTEARPTADVDEDLYGGFITPEDRRLLDRLREMSPQALSERVHDRPPSFADGRLEELLFRWRARNFPDTLGPQEQARWAEHCQARLLEGAGGALSLPAFFERIDQLGQALPDDDERGQEILGQLYEYAEGIAPA